MLEPQTQIDPASPNAITVTGIPQRPSAGVLLLTSVVAGFVFWMVHRGHVRELWFEDLPVYIRAFHQWTAGQNPYNGDLAPLYFLYPPIFLFMAGFVWHLLPNGWGPYFYGATHLTSTFALPLVLSRFYFRRVWLGPLFATILFFASPRFTGILALASFNIATILYCLAFVAGIPGIKRNRWQWFYAAVFFAAIIKITFLALLLLPLLAGRRQWLRSICCGAAVIAANFAERLAWPQLYSGYQAALHQGILVQQSYGYGLFGLLASYHHTQNPVVGTAPYAISLMFSAGLAIGMFFLRRRLEPVGEAIGNPMWLALVISTIILVNPREMQYDIDIALFSGFVLWVYARNIRRPIILMILLFLPSLFVPLVVLNPHLHGVYETCISLIAFGFGYGCLWREAGAGWAGVSSLIEEPV